MAEQHMDEARILDRELKKGSAEMLIMALVEARPRHGYEIARLIEERSGGVLQFHAASLYPLLYRLERRGLVRGRWVEKAGQRRRRYYRLTPAGRRVLAAQRSTWQEFFAALDRVARITPGPEEA
ncbi:MAG TPA: PadR family transcriptional regulator [Pyrinomonadaceae bacterium]|nr:PadR family transcriptional regulator [Pyrinomonadaceae bacterium]